ncbi:MAG: TonB-dependent receptor plug domain-containing protein [Labilibaculum sp.]|nr:TonB-dependent receptor plug domain-containing protein [Labilibaculum sp.]MBI9057123.1 TonB-dependent receptor plug domain-containing protein [Labilibaculum sp.]
MKLKLGIIGLLVCLAFTNAQGQEAILKGKVITFKGYPVANATVAASKSKQTTTTDSLGYYSISCRAKKDNIKIKVAGFVGQNFRYRGEKEHAVNLIYIHNESSYYNVIKNKTMTKEKLDYCIENLLHENNNFDRMANIFQIIQFVHSTAKIETINGVKTVVLNSRGPNSIHAGQQALLVVDGIVTEDIGSVSPKQVKSVEVLIGNEASEYGVRAANGVIKIKLKDN